MLHLYIYVFLLPSPQIGSASDSRSRALLDLVDQIVGEPAYNSLRTQQQLGYTVGKGTFTLLLVLEL